MAAAAKSLRRQGGDAYNLKDPVQVPVSTVDLAVAVDQLQATVNELIARLNDHTHDGVTVGAGVSGATTAGKQVVGTAVTATNKFVSPAQ